MALSVFVDRDHAPGSEELSRALGATAGLWGDLRSAVEARFAPVTAEWGFGSPSTGWGLRLKGRKRTILYMVPRDGHFLASLALGERAVAAARQAGLSSVVLEVIEAAPRYAEGRGVRVEVRTAEDIRDVLRLAEIKMAH